ncbi:SDR family oxidoreductase [Actinomadura macra]|uniref:SDR family oxidoreductase n=1 Tax=Actinomadura macra TaxID=46164 RepID=UPI0008305FB7|nr:SDR family oxidoreductase [Actinomadura macra]
MTRVVTGGAGFVGLHLVREQLFQGRHVTVLSHVRGGRDRIEGFLAATGELDQLPVPLKKSLTVLPVDLEQPMLGMSRIDYRRLAATTAEIWHVAGAVDLHGKDAHVWRTNVHGTENLLRLASLSPGGTPLRHISTAFVAGTRQGHVREDDGEPTEAFENAYEHAKHEAEALVRDWADREGRRALIFRPGLLVPPGPRTVPDLPAHALSTLYEATRQLAGTDGRTELRVAADPRAQLNLLPVDWAARAMEHLASNDEVTGVSVVHVVHSGNVPVRVIAAALEDVCSVRIRMTPAMPAEPTILERDFHRQIAGFLPYFRHRRHFDDTALRERVTALVPPPNIDRPYLRFCFGAPVTAPRTTEA